MTIRIRILRDITVSAMGRRFQSGEVDTIDEPTAAILIGNGYAVEAPDEAADAPGELENADGGEAKDTLSKRSHKKKTL